jgi:hypothetical protein
MLQTWSMKLDAKIMIVTILSSAHSGHRLLIGLRPSLSKKPWAKAEYLRSDNSGESSAGRFPLSVICATPLFTLRDASHVRNVVPQSGRHPRQVPRAASNTPSASLPSPPDRKYSQGSVPQRSPHRKIRDRNDKSRKFVKLLPLYVNSP